MNPMYRVSIYDKSRKKIASYERIHTICYINIIGENISVSGEEMLTHSFPTDRNYHLLSDDGNFSVDKSIIGTFEITKVVY